jgi:hypothetical protein
MGAAPRDRGLEEEVGRAGAGGEGIRCKLLDPPGPTKKLIEFAVFGICLIVSFGIIED